ncbi:hypothetical protein [Streptomyces albidus (ex Kaewkla and Franco 2022)]|uniref:hypothetical protein n=1 Tax=Streptomyces albidus (ex Kaewkla and Franco 2022) TaxID=722709 RepID=UPI0015EF06D5|nr:hypothetical protein [Streptomyces albidus (ex Kaewkla and Franco 2022)]
MEARRKATTDREHEMFYTQEAVLLRIADLRREAEAERRARALAEAERESKRQEEAESEARKARKDWSTAA